MFRIQFTIRAWVGFRPALLPSFWLVSPQVCHLYTSCDLRVLLNNIRPFPSTIISVGVHPDYLFLQSTPHTNITIDKTPQAQVLVEKRIKRPGHLPI